MFLWKTRLKNTTSLLSYTKVFHDFRRVKSPYSQRIYKDKRVEIYIVNFKFFEFFFNWQR